MENIKRKESKHAITKKENHHITAEDGKRGGKEQKGYKAIANN